VHWGILTANTDRRGKNTIPSPMHCDLQKAVGKIMRLVSRCIILCPLRVSQFTNSNEGIGPNDYNMPDKSRSGSYELNKTTDTLNEHTRCIRKATLELSVKLDFCFFKTACTCNFSRSVFLAMKPTRHLCCYSHKL